MYSITNMPSFEPRSLSGTIQGTIRWIWARMSSLCLALALIYFPQPLIGANATEVVFPSQFKTSSPPQISFVTVRGAANQEIPTVLTPTEYYIVYVNVIDPDGLGQLTSVTLKLWFDSSGLDPASTFDLVEKADANHAALAIWSRAANSLSVHVDGSWTIDLLGKPNAEQLNDPTVTAYEFAFRVRVGKVARQTLAANDRWQVAARAIDSVNTSAFAFSGSDGIPGLLMDWYGEIIIQGSTSIDWGFVPVGMAFADDLSRYNLSNTSLTFISNGNYQELVKCSTTWENPRSQGQPARLSLDTQNDNTFAIKASRSAVAGPDNAVPLNPDGSTAIIFASGVMTSESGDSISDHSLWLALSNVFSSAGAYQGTLTYAIANR